MLEGRQRAVVLGVFVAGFALVTLLRTPATARRAPRAIPDEPRAAPLALERGPDSTAADFDDGVVNAALRYGLDPALVTAVITAESGQDPAAVSAKGAVGLMQVLPETAALVGLPESADPARNLEAGCRYLAGLMETFGGDVELALAAYNAGPGAVRHWGRMPPYRETQGFVARVAAEYKKLTGLDLRTGARF